MRIVSDYHSGGIRGMHFVSASLAMTLLFLSLLVYISMTDVASDWEIEFSQWVQTLRTPTLDKVMVYLTLTADWPLPC